ncbi:o-succinylbenzoate synthase [Pantoea sp. CCBC3-3-1]|uniref:o-succinylbenzoate synthase n=1 Tax=Pantoea sp. CCBC3-3-1 TaxID=2490851 RepID=UPI0011BEC5AE|nr:o-succinylbenzoate synthase [Pantoea sp. CCBC3-3-1]
MRQATLLSYNIPLAAGTVLRDRRVTTRCGWLVRLNDHGAVGWGEIAPLPGFSQETPDAALAAATCWLESWCNGENPAESPLPSVAFGVSCALAELNDELPEAGNYQSATLCVGDPDELFSQLSQQSAPVAKMKVGLYEPVRDGMIAALLLEALPTLTLRLDANRQWSLEKAHQFARKVPERLRSRIAFIEEPCRTQQESRTFARETGLALAWDESVREANFLPLAEPHLRAVVIKPMLTGSLSQVRTLIAEAQRAGLTAVISSSVESSLGLTQLARVAEWLTPGVTPGLDTLALMQQQLVRRWPHSSLPLLTADDLVTVWQR